MTLGHIAAVALDVDGVLTDGAFWWGPQGEEFKRFCFLDVMGISLGNRSGLIFALVSGEDTPQVQRYATKMHIADVWTGCKDKASALREFAARHRLDLAQICFIGDDVNDLEALRLAGCAACPATAHACVREVADFVSPFPGGQGAVRDVVDRILAERGTPTENASPGS